MGKRSDSSGSEYSKRTNRRRSRSRSSSRNRHRGRDTERSDSKRSSSKKKQHKRSSSGSESSRSYRTSSHSKKRSFSRSRNSGSNKSHSKSRSSKYHPSSSKRKSKSRSRSRDRERRRDDMDRDTRSKRDRKRRRDRSSSTSSSNSSPSSSSSSSADSKACSSRKDGVANTSTPKLSAAALLERIEEKLDVTTQIHRQQAIDDIESEGFAPKSFKSTKPPKLEDIPMPSLDLKPINLASLKNEVLCHPNLIINQREREEQWVKRLFGLRQRMFGSDVERIHTF